MRLVKKVYQMWGPNVTRGVRFQEMQGFKNALCQEGFRWTKSSAHSRLDIHDGGDILCGDRYKVGELVGNQITIFGSSRLERFLDTYDD